MRLRVYEFARLMMTARRWRRIGDAEAAAYASWIGWKWLIRGRSPTTVEYRARSRRSKL